ncbi:MAG: spondin domain-containing protein [bacterium]|nr:spondin domain-containing protein [bacterium]
MQFRPQLTHLFLVLAFLAWGCNKSPNPVSQTSSSGNDSTMMSSSETARLAKQTTGNSGTQTLVVATVTQNGVPMAGVNIALSNSVSGRSPNYQWQGSTDTNGRASITIGSESGYYLARATNPTSGNVIGTWNSIPINRGLQTFLSLPIGGSASAAPGTRAEATFRVRIENISQVYPFAASGVFNTPAGASSPAPIGPGAAYEFNFHAPPGSRLSFATMFVHSNDFFYAPDESGIALWNTSGQQVSGDVTAQIRLWDSGTEINQEPGTGLDQAPRQSGPNTGAVDPNNTVRLAPDTFSNLPAASSVVRVTLTPTSATGFRARIENISGSSSLPTPLAPGVWVVHTEPGPLFTSGQPDQSAGLEALAEDGNPAPLATSLAAKTGITAPLAPGVWAVHRTPGILFRSGHPNSGQGLEALAEDGNPASLATSLAGRMDVASSGAFNTPVGASGPGPLLPGAAYEFTFTASPGDKLSLATMFVPSNDFFYAPDESGIALWDAVGNPAQGNVYVNLWDAGTELDQPPGAGRDQAPFQSGPNTGAADPDTRVRLAPNTYHNLPATSKVLRVSILPQP